VSAIGLPFPGIDTINNPPGDISDAGEMGVLGFGFNRLSPGEWTVRPVADTGSTLSLITLTLMALGVAARQFKQAAA